MTDYQPPSIFTIRSVRLRYIRLLYSSFFVGIGLGGSLTVEFTLVQEFLATDKRLFVAVMSNF